MTLVIKFGVWDMPYSDKEDNTVFTAAKALQKKYKIFYHFKEMEKQLISDEVGLAVLDLYSGKAQDVYLPEVAAKFRDYIDERKFDGLPGVPTKAAKRGINHRKKNVRGKWKKHAFGKAFIRNPERPSFLDTGLFQNAVDAVVEIRE